MFDKAVVITISFAKSSTTTLGLLLLCFHTFLLFLLLIAVSCCRHEFGFTVFSAMFIKVCERGIP